jgi:prepilin-type N-terminal cleavage/methylation domain-containing protein
MKPGPSAPSQVREACVIKPFHFAWCGGRGFSLVEVLVVIAIMAVVAGMIVATAAKIVAVIHQWK